MSQPQYQHVYGQPQYQQQVRLVHHSSNTFKPNFRSLSRAAASLPRPACLSRPAVPAGWLSPTPPLAHTLCSFGQAPQPVYQQAVPQVRSCLQGSMRILSRSNPGLVDRSTRRTSRRMSRPRTRATMRSSCRRTAAATRSGLRSLSSTSSPC